MLSEHYILTKRIQEFYLPKLLVRDEGFFCFYDGNDLSKTEFVYEHLDDNRSNNDINNIVLACRKCNNKKPFSPEMKAKARKKKKENEQSNLLRASERARVEVSSPSFKPELDISQANFETTNQFLSETLSVDQEIEFRVALDSAVMLCRKQTGSGSQTAVKRYLDALTSSEGPFMVVQDDQKKKVITWRDGK